MRRLAVVFLSCLGLTLIAAAPVGAAKPVPLTALSFTSVQVVPGADADHCYVDLTWTAAPDQTPKGTTFEGYRVPVSTDPNPDWISLSAFTFDQPQGRVSEFFPLPNDGSTLYFNVTAVWYKVKGKFTLTNTPFGEPIAVVLSC